MGPLSLPTFCSDLNLLTRPLIPMVPRLRPTVLLSRPTVPRRRTLTAPLPPPTRSPPPLTRLPLTPPPPIPMAPPLPPLSRTSTAPLLLTRCRPTMVATKCSHHQWSQLWLRSSESSSRDGDQAQV